MKKLIPALCMLLVAACLMGTSTYAWFAAGTTVEATGMAIKATSSGGLAITTSATKSDDSLEAVDFTAAEADVTTGWNNAANKVAPTSSADGEDWYTAVGKDINDGDAKSGYTLAVKDAISADETLGGSLFYQAQVYVKTLNTNAADGKAVTLYVKSLTIDLGANNNNLTKALRVAFKCGSNWVVFSPYRTAAGTHVSAGTAVADGSNYILNAVAGSSTTAALAELTYGDDVYAQVDMFVYFEGEDPACTTNNAINLDTIAVDVTFEATTEH